MSSSKVVCQNGILIRAKFSPSDPKLDSIGSLEKFQRCPIWHGGQRSVKVLEASSRTQKLKKCSSKSLLDEETLDRVTIFVKQKILLLDDDDLRCAMVLLLERHTGHMIRKLKTGMV